MAYCNFCRKTIPDQMCGLINFAMTNHKCPAMQFQHCPKCGTDIDTMEAFFGYKNKHALTEEQIREILEI